jgi:hypothetical protein
MACANPACRAFALATPSRASASRPAVPDNARVVDDFLELGGGFLALSSRQIEHAWPETLAAILGMTGRNVKEGQCWSG